jgi:hypothetical protein
MSYEATRRIADTAGNTLNKRFDAFPLVTLRSKSSGSKSSRCRGLYPSTSFLHLRKEGRHIHYQIPDHRKVWERFQRNFRIELVEAGTTCPSRPSVYPESASSTHSHPARVSETNSRVLLMLESHQGVQNSHARADMQCMLTKICCRIICVFPSSETNSHLSALFPRVSKWYFGLREGLPFHR